MLFRVPPFSEQKSILTIYWRVVSCPSAVCLALQEKWGRWKDCSWVQVLNLHLVTVQSPFGWKINPMKRANTIEVAKSRMWYILKMEESNSELNDAKVLEEHWLQLQMMMAESFPCWRKTLWGWTGYQCQSRQSRDAVMNVNTEFKHESSLQHPRTGRTD